VVVSSNVMMPLEMACDLTVAPVFSCSVEAAARVKAVTTAAPE
jgi:hypothetical protein